MLQRPSFRLRPSLGIKALRAFRSIPSGCLPRASPTWRLLGRPLDRRDLGTDDEPAEPAKIRVGLYRCALLEGADPEMRAALFKAADKAADAGFDVGEIGEPEAMAMARGAHSDIQNFEAGLVCGSDLALFGNQMSEILAGTLNHGQAISPQAYDAARKLAKRGRAATRALFGEVDILLTPAAPGAAPLGLETTGDPRFNKLWTLMGTPVVSNPGFRDRRTRIAARIQAGRPFRSRQDAALERRPPHLEHLTGPEPIVRLIFSGPELSMPAAPVVEPPEICRNGCGRNAASAG